jgi:hypothetical protein
MVAGETCNGGGRVLLSALINMGHVKHGHKPVVALEFPTSPSFLVNTGIGVLVAPRTGLNLSTWIEVLYLD